MRVAVLDDGSPLGSGTVEQVKNHGLDVVVIFNPRGSGSVTQADLADKLAGCSVVIDLAGPPSLGDGTLTEEYGLVIDEESLLSRVRDSVSMLLAAEAAVGVHHHIALSVVGVDRMGTEGAFRALLGKERMVAGSGVPYSIIRSTQVFETVVDVAEAATEDWIVWLPPVRTRPVAGEEVATLLAHTAAFSPLQGVKEIAGPEQFRLDTFVRQALTAEHEHRQVFTDWRSTFFGSRVRRDDLLPGPGAYIAQRLYGEWLIDRTGEGHRTS
ncbi:SDR family oxidoreductase [Streptomyces humi]|uniref:SDR family oxidoreductase n=1 Tax=Streptomyces humi TaxID=1428620 RepID=UPI0006288C30|nr:SDR family oxidoreductase [Streptomyces humi]